MKSLSSWVLCSLLLVCGFGLMSSNLSQGQETKADEEKPPGKILRHVVLFKFKKEVSEEQIKEVTDAFAALPKKIDLIKDFEWGTDVSVENKAAGYTHGFIVSFASEKARDDYLPHPAHQDFVKLVGPRLGGVLVFDFWAKAE